MGLAGELGLGISDCDRGLVAGRVDDVGRSSVRVDECEQELERGEGGTGGASGRGGQSAILVEWLQFSPWRAAGKVS
jgi:hypothetical protein